MFIIIAIIIVGILIGTQIRSDKAPAVTSKLLFIIVHVLLLVMGIVVGGNETIVNNLSTIGLKAFIITFGSFMGSVICAAIIYRYVFKRGE
ncbi:MAG: LysO family transporter [Rikenellaceae bacterium]